MFYVYLYRDPSGIPMYVGKGRDSRATDHLKKSKRRCLAFHTALEKLLECGHVPSVEILASDLAEDEAYELEKETIKSIGRRCDGTGPLYNLAKGGNGGSGPRSVETRAKIASRLAGVPKTTETLSKMRGRRLSPEHVAKMKANRLGQSNPASKTWILQDPSGQEIVVEALYTFCRENNLSYSSIVASIDNAGPIKRGKSAGWKLKVRSM